MTRDEIMKSRFGFTVYVYQSLSLEEAGGLDLLDFFQLPGGIFHLSFMHTVVFFLSHLMQSYFRPSSIFLPPASLLVILDNATRYQGHQITFIHFF